MLKWEALLYTDGACSGNPGPGGWGSVLFNKKKNKIFELGGSEAGTTNNRMEMTAIIEGLVLANDQNISTVLVLTDSTYVIRGYTQWRHGWKKRGWTNSENQPVLNQDLWKKLEQVAHPLKIEWRYVRGHQGTPGNERVDEIAVAYSKHQMIDLEYDLSPENYHFDILDIPTGEPVPEMKSKKTETRQSFYVSLVNGVLSRHNDWSSCERTVKGQSKALFKKVSSEEEFQEIIKKWGHTNGN